MENAMRTALLSVAVLAACVPARQSGPEAAWSIAETPGGRTLTAADARGPVVAMTCVKASRGLVVQAFRMTPVGSDEEFSFGTSDYATLLVADPDAGGTGVVARGPLPEPVLNSMLSGAAIQGVYGGQRLGPLTAPLDVAGSFAGACIAPSPERMGAIGPASVAPSPQDGSTVIRAGRPGAFAE
jgi:hypothetical protein